MKREILFRGQLIDTKEWVYGTYHYSNDSKFHYILNREKMLLRAYHNDSEMALHEKEVHEVIPETVGQFTGLTDKKRINIFEGDIVVAPSIRNGVIEYGHSRFGINWDYGTKRQTMLGSWGSVDNLRTLSDNYNSELEVIGNIHENPEMLESSF